jgi:hypothetical protein
LKVEMDIYVHIAVGAAIGALTKSTANLVFPALDEECDQSVSCKLAHAIEWATVYGAGFTGGLISHAFLDALPHGDYLAHYGWLLPDSLWMLRELIAAVIVLLLIIIGLRGRSRLVALVAGIGGALLDVDNLAISMGLIKRSQAISPSHSGVWAHGQNLGWISFVLEIGLFLFAMGFLFLYGWQQSRQSVRPSRPGSKAGYAVSGRAEELHAPPVLPSGR